MDIQDESSLVRRAQAGDREAFAALIDAYWERIYQWLCGLVQDRHEAEDLTQDAFLRAWAMLPSLRSCGSFRPWLFRIARNAVIDNRRATHEQVSDGLSASVADRDPGPEAAAVIREGEGLLRQACARLPEIYRAPFLLWTQEALPYGEIAHILALTEETARWRVCKARHLLVKELGSYLDKKLS